MTEPVQHNITLLKIYLYARTALAAMLIGLFFVAAPAPLLGSVFPNIYFWTSVSYLAICLFTLIVTPPAKLEHSFNRVGGYLIIDVLAIMILIHTSGGVDGGLGYLLLIFAAMAGVLIRGQLGIAFAAMTSLLVIGETVYLFQMDQATTKTVVSAGFLGILLFSTAYAFQVLSDKVRTSRLEAETQARVAAHLQKLAQAIIARMRTGIVVLSPDGRLELINDSALQLLDLAPQIDISTLTIHDIPSLKDVSDNWQHNTIGPYQVIELRAGVHARLSIASIDLGNHSRTVLYLEDHRVMTQQAQQLKLASLGRLTASIAHEVRNPLGAISHAAQLLAESPDIVTADRRLTEIIFQHSKRVNQIIESTLALSRRKEPQPDTLDLTNWIPRFINFYKAGQKVSIEFKIGEGLHLIKMDPTHLSQVLTNLVDNGSRYSAELTGEAKVTLALRKTPNDDTSYLDVIDYGKGIGDEHIDHIFDPFYTTEEKGSGLGLYISKELCEINQASLHYRPTPHGGGCFRINFSHHQRMF
jgi:two-component system, NtrC family, sensor histidine kinase PilS